VPLQTGEHHPSDDDQRHRGGQDRKGRVAERGQDVQDVVDDRRGVGAGVQQVAASGPPGNDVDVGSTPTWPEWQEILETAMRFATNCATAYARASANTRRRFNQAVFTRIDVRDGKFGAVGYHPPFDLLFSSSEFEYGDLDEWAVQDLNL
jgi:hypothetical protein